MIEENKSFQTQQVNQMNGTDSAQQKSFIFLIRIGGDIEV